VYVLPESKWYIGELIEEVTVEGEPRNIVHRNVTLIYAHSPEEAYQKALALDKKTEAVHEDPAGKLVHTRFWGLAELNVLHDDPRPGAELFYQEQIGVPGEKAHHWVLPRTTLKAYHSLETASTSHFNAEPATTAQLNLVHLNQAQPNQARKPSSQP